MTGPYTRGLAASRTLQEPALPPIPTTNRPLPLTQRISHIPGSYRHATSQRWQSTASTPADYPSTSARTFTYKLAAAYSGKRNKFNPAQDHFTYNTLTSSRTRFGTSIPPNIPQTGRLASGQDAVFISTVGQPPTSTSPVAFGVADGVGGWQDQGIDSAAFAHGICGYMSEAAKYHDSSSPLSPQALLKTAYERVCNDRSITGGGSTACLGVADSAGTLRVANLGDSGFMQLRQRKVHHYSDPQTHAFNTPYQLSRIPPKILAQMQEFGGGAPFSDMPGDAGVSQHEVRHGDVFVFATDGVWDNLSSGDILGVVAGRSEGEGFWAGDGGVGDTLVELDMEGKSAKEPLQARLAMDIVRVAKDAGLNSRRDGPFAKEFQRKFPGEGFVGGKADDIAVVVAIALEEVTGKHGESKL